MKNEDQMLVGGDSVLVADTLVATNFNGLESSWVENRALVKSGTILGNAPDTDFFLVADDGNDETVAAFTAEELSKIQTLDE